MSTKPKHESLQRTAGVPAATLLGLGSILGTGVYFAIPDAAIHYQSSMIFPVLLAAVLATCNALSSAQLAAAFPVSGGTYEYGYQLISPLAGFAAGWMFLCAKSASAAAAALESVHYTTGRPALLPAVGLIVVMTILVSSGLRRSTWMNTLLVAATIIGLLAFAAAAASTKSQPITATSNSQPLTTGQWLQLTALMFVAFTGYGRVATLGEEVKNPRRTIPLAVLTTLTISAVLYIVTAAAVDRLGKSANEDAVHNLSSLSSGRLRQVVQMGALAAMLGVLLNLVLGLSRVVLAMARRGDLPHTLSRLNKDHTTPVFAVLTTGGIVCGLTLLGNPRTAWSLSAVTVLIYYGLTNLAALRLSTEDRLYPRWISFVGLCGCLLLAAFVEPRSWFTAVVLLAGGLLLRTLLQKRNHSASETTRE